MHELSVVQSFVETTERCAVENGAEEIKFVVFAIGALTGVEPRYVKSYYPDVVQGTMLEHAELRIEEVEAIGFCRQCGNSFLMDTANTPCSECGSHDVEILQGNQLLIKEIGFI